MVDMRWDYASLRTLPRYAVSAPAQLRAHTRPSPADQVLAEHRAREAASRPPPAPAAAAPPTDEPPATSEGQVVPASGASQGSQADAHAGREEHAGGVLTEPSGVPPGGRSAAVRLKTAEGKPVPGVLGHFDYLCRHAPKQLPPPYAVPPAEPRWKPPKALSKVTVDMSCDHPTLIDMGGHTVTHKGGKVSFSRALTVHETAAPDLPEMPFLGCISSDNATTQRVVGASLEQAKFFMAQDAWTADPGALHDWLLVDLQRAATRASPAAPPLDWQFLRRLQIHTQAEVLVGAFWCDFSPFFPKAVYADLDASCSMAPFIPMEQAVSQKGVVLLDQFPTSQHRRILQWCRAAGPHWTIVAWRDGPSRVHHKGLQPDYVTRDTFYEDMFICRKPQWWTSGDTEPIKAARQILWWHPCAAYENRRQASRRSAHFKDLGRHDRTIAADFAWTARYPEHVEAYFKHHQLAHLRFVKGKVVATDGSVHKVQEDGETAIYLGCGIARRKKTGSIGAPGKGRGTAYQAELWALYLALLRHKKGVLHIVMDTAAVITGIRKWLRDLFRPAAHVAGGPYYQSAIADTLKAVLHLLDTRQDPVHFYKVKSHAGMKLNEEADQLAKQGAEARAPRFWEEGDNMGLVYSWTSTDGKDNVTRPGAAVRKAAREYLGRVTTARLIKKEACPKQHTITGSWMLWKDMGRKFLGKLWKCKAPQLRRLALAISHSFPVQATLHKWGKVPSGDCPFCKKCDRNGKRCKETVTHFASVCPRFRRARTRAGLYYSTAVHNHLMSVLPKEDGWEALHETTVLDSKLLAGKEGRVPHHLTHLLKLRPDSIFINPEYKRVAIVECQRTMDNFKETIARSHWSKRRKYLDLRQAIHSALETSQPTSKGWQVEVLPFIMGVKSTVKERDWTSNLRSLGVPPRKLQAMATRLVKVNWQAFVDMTGTRAAALAGLKRRQREQDQPPAATGG